METKEEKVVKESVKIISDEKLINAELEKVNLEKDLEKLEASTQRIYKDSYFQKLRNDKTINRDLSTNLKIRGYIRNSVFLPICKKVVKNYNQLNRSINKTKQTDEFKQFSALVQESLISSNNRPQFKSKTPEKVAKDRILNIAFMILHSDQK